MLFRSDAESRLSYAHRDQRLIAYTSDGKRDDWQGVLAFLGTVDHAANRASTMVHEQLQTPHSQWEQQPMPLLFLYSPDVTLTERKSIERKLANSSIAAGRSVKWECDEKFRPPQRVLRIQLVDGKGTGASGQVRMEGLTVYREPRGKDHDEELKYALGGRSIRQRAKRGEDDAWSRAIELLKRIELAHGTADALRELHPSRPEPKRGSRFTLIFKYTPLVTQAEWLEIE